MSRGAVDRPRRGGRAGKPHPAAGAAGCGIRSRVAYLRKLPDREVVEDPDPFEADEPRRGGEAGRERAQVDLVDAGAGHAVDPARSRVVAIAQAGTPAAEAGSLNLPKGFFVNVNGPAQPRAARR